MSTRMRSLDCFDAGSLQQSWTIPYVTLTMDLASETSRVSLEAGGRGRPMERKTAREWRTVDSGTAYRAPERRRDSQVIIAVEASVRVRRVFWIIHGCGFQLRDETCLVTDHNLMVVLSSC